MKINEVNVKNIADKEEMLKVLDENGNFVGKFEKRSVVHQNKLFHDEVALWIIDKENKKVLVQRRSPNKKQNPNKLAICAGHVVADETVEEALLKESKEEIGIDAQNYEVFKLATVKVTKPQNHCFCHHYYIEANIPLENFVIQEEELSEVFYMDYLKLKALVMANDDEVAFKWTEENKKIFDLLDKIIL